MFQFCAPNTRNKLIAKQTHTLCQVISRSKKHAKYVNKTWITSISPSSWVNCPPPKQKVSENDQSASLTESKGFHKSYTDYAKEHSWDERPRYKRGKIKSASQDTLKSRNITLLEIIQSPEGITCNIVKDGDRFVKKSFQARKIPIHPKNKKNNKCL